MRQTLCIASRGHPVDLLRVIAETDARIARPENVTISIALDSDDDSVPAKPETRAKLVWDIGEREDSLGEKYNRCARNAPADVYVLGADDNVFTTDKWDEIVREHIEAFEDNFGFVYFGRLDGTLPTQMAIPAAVVETQGFLFPSHWPFWFHDSWIDEIAHMTGRILWADISIEEIGGRGGTRGLQEITFWANLFELLRSEREKTAAILSATFNPHWLDTQLKQRRGVLDFFFASRTERLRNPATALHYQRRMSYDAKTEPRYERLKALAQSLMDSRKEKAA